MVEEADRVILESVWDVLSALWDEDGKPTRRPPTGFSRGPMTLPVEVKRMRDVLGRLEEHALVARIKDLSGAIGRELSEHRVASLLELHTGLDRVVERADARAHENDARSSLTVADADEHGQCDVVCGSEGRVGTVTHGDATWALLKVLGEEKGRPLELAELARLVDAVQERAAAERLDHAEALQQGGAEPGQVEKARRGPKQPHYAGRSGEKLREAFQALLRRIGTKEWRRDRFRWDHKAATVLCQWR